MLSDPATEPGWRPRPRPHALGKFIYSGGRKLYVRGVTYGTFQPNERGEPFPDPETVRRDLRRMSKLGINSVRVYTVPPPWLLDEAMDRGLRLLIGLPWQQHVAFLDDSRLMRDIERRVREGVRACLGHPAVLAYVIGNEIPAPIVRWHGPRPIERFLERLHGIVKSEDPGALVTYANYPTTEYLDLSFLEVVSFNLYLESREALQAYLARLQNLAQDRPLLVTELGLDSRRHGLLTQARALEWEVRAAFSEGCAGVCVFAWTDEWHRGGHAVEDWDFGLTRRSRQPKPAYEALRKAYREVPFAKEWNRPFVSVVVCCYNEEATIRECLEGLEALDYPHYEVIVVDDGSQDGTAAIARQFPFRLIRTENRGLGAARNLGIECANGEIVAFIDADAWPDPDWLSYLAAELCASSHAAVGGPNFPCPEDGIVAQCVAAAPGGPTHVLLSDREAEHIPGCNMAFYREALLEIGGFDTQFRIAGDDVDVCWALQKAGWTLGYSPAAVVWHHRRSRIRAFWRQQENYGRAEALLERKWPEKYNANGHPRWSGRLYARSIVYRLTSHRRRIYYGIWGSAPFQKSEDTSPGYLCLLASMPEWYMGMGALAAVSALGVFWKPLLVLAPLFLLALALTLLQTGLSARRAYAHRRSDRQFPYWRMVLLTMGLHLLQPLARLKGRSWSAPAAPRAADGARGPTLPIPRSLIFWCESWHSPQQWLESLLGRLRSAGAMVRTGAEVERWDLEVREGRLAGARVRIAVEEHGSGRQLVRFRISPKFSTGWLSIAFASIVGGLGAALAGAWLVAAVFGGIAWLTLRSCLRQARWAAAAIESAAARVSRTWSAFSLDESLESNRLSMGTRDRSRPPGSSDPRPAANQPGMQQ